MNLTDNLETFTKKFTYHDLIIFAIPFLLFSYYLFVFNPGILSYDTYYQLHQIATNSFNNWHPFFHTFIEMMCLKVYPNPLSISLFQISIFSIMWMAICKYFRRNNDENNKLFLIQVIITLFISLIPINAIYSIFLVKDILFSYFLMFLCFLMKVLLDKKGYVNYSFVILISLVMAFIAQLRPNGIYVILPLLVILGVYLFKNNKIERLYMVIPALTIIFILSISALSIIYEVKDIQNDAVMDKVTHMLADYDLTLDLNDADRNKLHQLMPEKDIKTYYQITAKDPLRNNAVNKEVWQKNKMEYITMAISYSLKNPIRCIQYLFESAPLVWDITRDDSWSIKGAASAEVYFTDINNNKGSFYKSMSTQPAATFDDASAKNVGTESYNSLNSFVNFVKDDALWDMLFDSPALYMYLSIIILAGLQLLIKSKEIWLIYLPNLLNILVIFISIPVQANRYLYSNLLVCYLLIIILVSTLLIKKNNNSKI